MENNKQDLFKKLLRQINWENKHGFEEVFTNAEIQKVEVHVESKVWNFHLQIEDILPYEVFYQFYQQLQLAFKDIAKVDITLHTKNPIITNQKLGDYWKWVVFNSGIQSSLYKNFPEVKYHI